MVCCGKIKSAAKSAAHVAHGAKQIVKAHAGVGLAPDDTVEFRRDICRACDKAKPCSRRLERKCVCSACGCRLAEKTVMADESCPLNKWHAVSAKR